jgi:hypothetical protein
LVNNNLQLGLSTDEQREIDGHSFHDAPKKSLLESAYETWRWVNGSPECFDCLLARKDDLRAAIQREEARETAKREAISRRDEELAVCTSKLAELLTQDGKMPLKVRTPEHQTMAAIHIGTRRSTDGHPDAKGGRTYPTETAFYLAADGRVYRGRPSTRSWPAIKVGPVMAAKDLIGAPGLRDALVHRGFEFPEVPTITA